MKIEEWEKEQKAASDLSRNPKFNKWECLIDGHLSRKNEHYIDWVLIPLIKDWEPQDWGKQGFAALNWLMQWESTHNFGEIVPWIRGKDGRQNTLATILHLPTDKGWLPAIDCYAGKAWDGPEAFDAFYQAKTGRGLIQSFENWCGELQEIDKDKWKGLLRWIGVSWEPKIHQVLDFTIDDHPLWSSYKSKHNNVTLEGGHNYLIDDFPNCLSSIGNTKLLIDIFPALSKLTGEHAQRNWKYPTGKVINSSSPKAFAFEQLSKAGWLPVKRSLLENETRLPPYKTFLPRKGLNGLLPEVDRTGIDDDTWHGKDGTKAKLSELGVMENLPEDAQKWHEWMRKLAEKARTLKQEDQEAPTDWKDKGARVLWRAARSLYREYLTNKRLGSFPESICIPCVCIENNQRLLDFTKPEHVHWIDESHLADTTLEKKLLSEGYKLFIFRLQEASEISRIGVQKLSEVIEYEPDYDASPCDLTHELSQRFEDRRVVLNRVVLNKVVDTQLPEKIPIEAVTDLTLKLSLSGKDLGKCSVLSWKQEGAGRILVDIKNKWRALAHALAHRLDDKFTKYVNDFEVYLSDGSDENVLARARDAGIPEEALQEVEDSLSLQTVPVKNEEVAGEASNDMSNLIPAKSRATHDTTSQTTVSADSGSTQAGNISGKGDKPKQTHERSIYEGSRKSDPRPETGLVAEEWLGKQLLKIWPQKVKKVHEGRDFTISFDDKTIHIEAKHVETRPGSIHWSRSQYETCKNKKPDYFIAVLSPDQDDQYIIHWIWSPLESLKKLDRKVTWSGKSSPSLLEEGYWEIEFTKPDTVPADSFHIEITLTEDTFNPENRDGQKLEKLKKRLDTLADKER